MNIIISRSDLLPHNPCPSGLRWFNDMVRMQGREDSLLIQGPLGLLQLYSNEESRCFASWARSKRVLPAFNGAGLDLRSLDLERAKLEGANLYRANLYRANLRWSDLYRADLQEANLEGANLYGANLLVADLEGTDLYKADLRRADLRWASRKGVDLEGARRLPEDHPIPGWKLANGLLTKE